MSVPIVFGSSTDTFTENAVSWQPDKFQSIVDSPGFTIVVGGQANFDLKVSPSISLSGSGDTGFTVQYTR